MINYNQSIDKVKSAIIPRCSGNIEPLEKCGPAALPQMEDLRAFQALSFWFLMGIWSDLEVSELP